MIRININKELLKRIALGALILGAAVAMGYLIYAVFFKPVVSPPEEPVNANVPPGTLPPTNVNTNAGVITTNINGQITTVLPSIDTVARGGNTLAERVEIGNPVGAQVTAAGLNYYDPASGQFFALDNQGNTRTLSEDIYAEVEQVTWNPEGDQAILEFPDGSNVMYDFNQDRQYTLPKEMEEFSFSETGNEIAFKYMTQNREDRWLGVSAPDGSQSDGVALLGDNEHKVIVDYSPNGQIVGMFWESVSEFENQIEFVGRNNENFKSIIVPGRGFQPKWSPTGSRLLYSTYSASSDYLPELSIVDAVGQDIGKNNANLGLRTWANKCAFADSATVYCGVPESLEYGAGLVPDIANSVPDRIYKIDLNTGTRSVVANPVDETGEQTFTVGDLFVSDDQQYLYFTDKNTGEVRKIQLF